MTTKLQDIPRVKAGTSVATAVRSLSEVDQERMYLATRAKDLLGYSGLTNHVTGEVKLGTCEGKLTQTLLSLEIPILDTSSVINYQLEELSRINREVATRRLRDWMTGYFVAASWDKTLLSDYTMPVPEFVLDKAVKIKEQLPNVQFYIQHMSDPKADPFLIAVLDREMYYVEAWDEPQFEATL